MLFTNAYIFQGKKGFIRGSLLVSDGRIREVIRGEQEVAGAPATDLQGQYVIPGLVDIHTHGNSGHDFSEGELEGLHEMGKYLAARGVTSFAPASMTLPEEQLKAAFMSAQEYHRERPRRGAKLLGIHMEGPYFSSKKKGAQNGAFLRYPDKEEFFRLQEAAGGLIRIVDVAPELPGAEAFIREFSSSCRVSVAHTDASYEETVRAFAAGASHVTHLFNAMPPFHHRAPGVIGAAWEQEKVTAELICDGHHVHPAAVRMAFRLFPGRICLVSDAVSCSGMPDGDYELAGEKVTLKDGEARLSDGHLAGAVCTLFEDMVKAIRWGISPEEAVPAATLTPAKVIGAEAEVGSLEAGKRADFLVCDRDWNLKRVFLEGQEIPR